MLRRACAILLAAVSSASGQLVVSARGGIDLPAVATDQHGEEFIVTGLSGIAYAGPRGAGHRFLCVMDNSNKIVEIIAEFRHDGSITAAPVVGGLSIADTMDFEGIAAAGRTVFLSEENTPAIREYRLSNGALADVVPAPPLFAHRRPNLGFESLTRAAGSMWTANEEALTIDGPLSTSTTGTVVRLLRYDVDAPSPAPAEQFAYVAAPIHGLVVGGARSGVSDLVLLPSGRLIALERSVALASPLFLTRIYEADFAGATDVSGFTDGLAGAAYTPVGKRLLYSGGHANLEGLCLGPRLENGNWSLVGVVDDADPLSTNRLVAFEIGGPVGPEPCPADWNGSGAVDSQDFFDFLVAFFAGDADVNADGTTNSADFFEFLNAFFGAC